jgi:hypothetical protein
MKVSNYAQAAARLDHRLVGRRRRAAVSTENHSELA